MTPSPTSTESEKVEIKGNLPEFSEEENAEWREKTKENIVSFFSDDYDNGGASLLPLDKYHESGELGIMGTVSPKVEKIAFCQVYVLEEEKQEMVVGVF